MRTRKISLASAIFLAISIFAAKANSTPAQFPTVTWQLGNVADYSIKYYQNGELANIRQIRLAVVGQHQDGRYELEISSLDPDGNTATPRRIYSNGFSAINVLAVLNDDTSNLGVSSIFIRTASG